VKRWVPVLIIVAVAAGLAWWLTHRHATRTELVLYGNIDLRQVDLPFHDSERVAEVLVEEGDHVKPGQLLARLDTSRLTPLVAKAQAVAAAQQQALLRLERGNRPQEIAEARATVDAARADVVNSKAQYERMRTLAGNSQGRAVSRQDLDAARDAYDSAQAHLVSAQKALVLERIGPREEDIAEARDQLRADEADLATAQQELADAALCAPLDTVVRSRLVEPGDMSSPTQPAFTLAIVDPKWVRAYVDEPDLGLVHQGMAAQVSVDSYPGRSFPGWVGFISPMAEFTPKTVETTQLRSSLVYEVRVFVRDPADLLRQGMPATVHLALRRSEMSGSATTASGNAVPGSLREAPPSPERLIVGSAATCGAAGMRDRP
jgi:HlyD family secretion protein